PPGLPAYFSMPSVSRSGGPNFLGAQYGPFVVSDDPNNPNFQIRDVALPRALTEDRFLDRKDLRQLVDRMKRIPDEAAVDPVPSVDKFYEQSYQLVTSREAQQAFDIHSEPEKVRD